MNGNWNNAEKEVKWDSRTYSRAFSEDRTSISSCGSEFYYEPGPGLSRQSSTASLLTTRSFLRKRILEIKQHESGITKGCRAMCVFSNPQAGTVKWVGKIYMNLYIGVEFDSPIGNNFPETKGAPPFPCKVTHSRLVLFEDVLVAYNSNGEVIHSKEDSHKRLESNKILSLPTSMSHETAEFSMKLDDFYRSCSSIEDKLENFAEQLDETFSKSIPIDLISLAVALEKTKIYMRRVGESCASIEICKNKCDELFTYEDILLPSEERKICRTLDHLQSFISNLEAKLSNRIKDLNSAVELCKKLEQLFQENLEWLNDAKTELRTMDNTPIKTEEEMTMRLKRIKRLRESFSADDTEELYEILTAIEELHDLTNKNPEIDNNNNVSTPCAKFDVQIEEVKSLQDQLLVEISKKYKIWKNSSKTFTLFRDSVKFFEEWFEKHLRQVLEFVRNKDTTSPEDFAEYMSMVMEREEKRREFHELLDITQDLRISIFDASVIEGKIQGLQTKWRVLMDSCYHEKFWKSYN